LSAGRVRLREALPADRAAADELTLRAYAEYAGVMAPSAWAGLDGAVRGALAAPGGAQRVVALDDDGHVIGSVFLFPPAVDAYGDGGPRADWPELRLLAVAPEARGRGVGRALVAECVRRARAMGAAALGLHTSASMTAAIALYEGLGFVRTPEHDFRPEGAELVTGYRLDLGSAAAG
jgi:ribosomal protein S18 acetylase RimI-like enzyme